MKSLFALAAFLAALISPASAQEAAPIPNECFLFTYFVGNGEDGLHLLWSRDGLKWETLGGGKSFLKPAVGESKLMRDPCVTRTPDGTFHMVWTTAWDGQSIGYAQTKDFLEWSDQSAAKVMANFADTKNCWAPELVFDAAKKQFLIFWASTVPSNYPLDASDRKYNHRIYSTTTTDFKTFAPAKVFFDPGYTCIDSTLVNVGNRWAMVFKDERQRPVKKNLLVAWSDTIYGPFTDMSEPFTVDWVEGPTALKLGSDWIVYYDEYTRKHYGAMKTRDFGKFDTVTSQLSFPRGVRHGTAIPVEGTLIKKLLAP